MAKYCENIEKSIETMLLEGIQSGLDTDPVLEVALKPIGARVGKDGKYIKVVVEFSKAISSIHKLHPRIMTILRTNWKYNINIAYTELTVSKDMITYNLCAY